MPLKLIPHTLLLLIGVIASGARADDTAKLAPVAEPKSAKALAKAKAKLKASESATTKPAN